MNYFSLFYYGVGVAIIFDIGFRLYQHFRSNINVVVADVVTRLTALEHYIAVNIDAPDIVGKVASLENTVVEHNAILTANVAVANVVVSTNC